MSDIRDLLAKYKENKISEEQLLKALKLDYLEKLGNLASLDIFRKERTGVPEVIFAQSKSIEMIFDIITHYLKNKDFVLISRIRDDQFELLLNFVKMDKNLTIEMNKMGRIAKIYKKEYKQKEKLILGKVGIITAGTSDIPVAEEAKMVCEAMNCEIISSYDVGIAGFHRIFTPLKEMLESNVDVIIVVAGMEGTLPGVVSALVDVNVIGVPTSNGYGFKGNGEGALTTMLQSCSPGLTVVNIDNGFGAGASAALISRRIGKFKKGILK